MNNMPFDRYEWKLKQYQLQAAISEKLFLHKDELSEEEKTLLVLEYINSTIEPGSWMGRSGFKKYIKNAMKIVKKYQKECSKE